MYILMYRERSAAGAHLPARGESAGRLDTGGAEPLAQPRELDLLRQGGGAGKCYNVMVL
jgi:hypothetical protein